MGGNVLLLEFVIEQEETNLQNVEYIELQQGIFRLSLCGMCIRKKN